MPLQSISALWVYNHDIGKCFGGFGLTRRRKRRKRRGRFCFLWIGEEAKAGSVKIHKFDNPAKKKEKKKRRGSAWKQRVFQTPKAAVSSHIPGIRRGHLETQTLQACLHLSGRQLHARFRYHGLNIQGWMSERVPWVKTLCKTPATWFWIINRVQCFVCKVQSERQNTVKHQYVSERWASKAPLKALSHQFTVTVKNTQDLCNRRS